MRGNYTIGLCLVFAGTSANPYPGTPGPGYLYQDTDPRADSDPDQHTYADAYADPRSHTPGSDR
jgi:hypothetical protein